MRLQDVWLRYDRRGPWVLRDVCVQMGPGEAAIVLGRNGAGKSTLLQLAAGVFRPGRGAVLDRPDRVGWVPERFPADQPFTIRQYLTGMGRMAGLTASAVPAAVDRWVERLGLAAYREVPLPQLSKGTAQKVGLAQALLVPPGLLVLDEPWEGLDAESRELVPELVTEVLTGGGSVLVSDHRGETARLPGALRWLVADGTVRPADAAAPAPPPAASAGSPAVAAAGSPSAGSSAASAGAPVAAAGSPAVAAGSPAAEPGGVSVVEVVVPTARVGGTVAALRAAGHEIRRVREESAR
ncbi:ATP-binding cassette domain-containing protein [Plantactinospora siamensis]|uniref:ATP-binding cassette domain-containing protein n=1 Tax=Plantactinospora siamensis TaxID=555372 RepID=A0ABV6NPW9_9ACTN